MPEGVEVSLSIEQLNKGFKNCILTGIDILGGRYSRHEKPKIRVPQKILKISNKGKFVYIILEKGVIFITLGMTGFLYKKGNNHYQIPHFNEKHDHIIFRTTCFDIYFNDMRNFGTIKYSTLEDLKIKLNKLGFDPLKENISFKDFYNHLKTFKNQKISKLLLNQKFVAGIGNYMRSDILYTSKIHPNTLINNINVKNLYNAIYKVFNNSYKKQKQNKFKFIIYKKSKDKYGNPVKKLKENGRTIWYVPKIQKIIS